MFYIACESIVFIAAKINVDAIKMIPARFFVVRIETPSISTTLFGRIIESHWHGALQGLTKWNAYKRDKLKRKKKVLHFEREHILFGEKCKHSFEHRFVCARVQKPGSHIECSRSHCRSFRGKSRTSLF